MPKLTFDKPRLSRVRVIRGRSSIWWPWGRGNVSRCTGVPPHPNTRGNPTHYFAPLPISLLPGLPGAAAHGTHGARTSSGSRISSRSADSLATPTSRLWQSTKSWSCGTAQIRGRDHGTVKALDDRRRDRPFEPGLRTQSYVACLYLQWGRNAVIECNRSTPLPALPSGPRTRA